MHLCHFSGVDGLAINDDLLFEYTKFFETLRKLEGDSVPVDFTVQLNLDFKSHRHFHAPASEVIRLYQSAYSICTSSDFLQNLQRKSHCCFPSPVLSNQKSGSLAG